MVKDITFPSIPDFPYDVIFSKNVDDLSDLLGPLAVRRSSDGLYASSILKLKELGKYSCKYKQLVNMCLAMKGKERGKIFIYHLFVQGSGTNLIVSVLNANGFVLNGSELSEPNFMTSTAAQELNNQRLAKTIRIIIKKCKTYF